MKRKIGKSELIVAPFVLGGNVFGWTADERASFEILDTYVDRGFNFIDTADMYSNWVPGNSGGESETIIGKWLKRRNRRDDLIIATKVGGDFSATQSGLKREYILSQVDSSLKRLQTDYIDIYYSHKDDKNTSIEETLSAYNELIISGKVRYIGASNMSAERLTESLNIAKEQHLPEYICLQPEYNLYDRAGYESEYSAMLLESGLGSFPYYSLASGFLTGKYKNVDDISSAARKDALGKYATPRGDSILKALYQVAEEHSATPAQISLAWLLSQPSVTAPIASVSRAEQLDILHYTEIKLNVSQIERLNKASAY